ncbi:MAG: M23 family metallopeptidase [bacterium]
MKQKRKKIHMRRKRLTVMLLPHGGRGSFQINISYLTLFMISAVWLGITGVSAYFISRKIENREILNANSVLKKKVSKFSSKLENTLDIVQQTTELNTQLRGMLALGEKSKIIEYSAAGGPSKLEDFQLSRLLLNTNPAESEELLNINIQELLAASWQTKTDFREISKYLNEKSLIARSTPAIWPAYGRMSSGFGWRINPITGVGTEFHKGIDIAQVKGTPIRATADGKVVLAGWAGGMGKSVILSHQMGYTTYYGHCEDVFAKQGETVKRGQIIASIGTTGRSTGYHLYYQIKRHGKDLNPMYFVNRSF